MKVISKKKVVVLIFVICILFILVTRLYRITEIKGMSVFGDEMGYWSHAANILGFRWERTIRAWYSYGYSLLLVPIFFAFNDIKKAYIAAIIANAIFAIIQFVFGIKIIKEINCKVKSIDSYIISLVATCVSAYIFQSYIGWPETVLYMFFTIAIYCFIKFVKKPCFINVILISAVISWLYIIHNRCIVGIISLFLVEIMMIYDKKLKVRNFCWSILIVCLFMALNGFIKSYLGKLMWPGEYSPFIGNNMSMAVSQSSIREDILQSVLSAFLSFCYKLWGLFSETFMIAYFGVVYVVRKIYEGKKRNEPIFYWYMFVLFFFIGIVSVSSIWMNVYKFGGNNVVRIDPLFYCRYDDVIVGILIILGMFEILNIREGIKENSHLIIAEVVFGDIFFLLVSYLLYNQISVIEQTEINVVCVPGLYFYKTFNVIAISITALIISCIVLFCSFSLKNKFIIYAILLTMFVEISNNAFDMSILTYSKENEKYESLYAFLDKMDSKYPIYICGANDKTIISRLRIRSNITKGIVVFDALECEDLIVIFPQSDYFKMIDRYPNCKIVACNENAMVLAVGEDLINEIEEKGYHCYNSNSILESINDINTYELYGKTKYKLEENSNLNVEITIASTNGGYVKNDTETLLSYHIFDEEGACIEYDGARYSIEDFVGEKKIEIEIGYDEFPKSGDYILEFDLLEEGVMWYEGKGEETFLANVEVE